MFSHNFNHVCTIFRPFLFFHPVLFSISIDPSSSKSPFHIYIFCYVFFYFAFELLSLTNADHTGKDMKVSTRTRMTHQGYRSAKDIISSVRFQLQLAPLAKETGMTNMSPVPISDWKVTNSFLYRPYVGNHSCCVQPDECYCHAMHINTIKTHFFLTSWKVYLN